MRIFLVLFILITGCSATVLTKTENSIALHSEFSDPYEAAREYCGTKNKIPDLVWRNGFDYKFDCVDK
jgi:hypothetical protein